MHATTARSLRSRWFVVLVAGLVAWTILALGMDNGIFGVFQDDGIYLSGARSLRDGSGYGLPGRPGEPPPKYPIGLPAVLALLLKLDPRPPSLDHEVAIARGLVVIGGWGFFLAAHTWLRRLGVRPAVACLIVLATAWHHVVAIGGAATLFADLPFAAVTYTLLAGFATRPRPGKGDRDPGRGGWLMGALAGFGFLLRTNGITLIAASLVAAAGQGDRRQRTALTCLLGAALLAVPATWYAGRHTRIVASGDYLNELQAGWSSPGAGGLLVARNLRAVILEWPTRVIASPTTYVDPVVRKLGRSPTLAWLIQGGIRAVIAVGLFGLVQAARRCDWPAWVHAVGSIAIFAVWPWPAILDRFLISLMPMVLLAFARGVEALLHHLPGSHLDRASRTRISALALLVVLAGNAAVVVRAAQFFHTHGGQWPGAPDRVDLAGALALIRDRTEPDAVIATIWPEMVSLQTGRTAVPICEDEAVMTGHYGDVSRLRRWHEVTRGRPFYFLRRDGQQDADHADDTQIATLIGTDARLSTKVIAQTPTGHHQLVRLVEPPQL